MSSFFIVKLLYISQGNPNFFTIKQSMKLTNSFSDQVRI